MDCSKFKFGVTKTFFFTWLVITLILSSFIFGPFGQKINEKIGEQVIDSKFGFSGDYFRTYLLKVKEKAQVDFIILHVIDIFFAMSYALSFWALYVLIYVNKLEVHHCFYFFIPLTSGIFDILENGTLILASNFTSSDFNFRTFWIFASIFNTAKWVSFAGTIVLLVVGIIMWLMSLKKNT